ncbi:MAG: hypothetical protein JXA30_00935 [Deltaproteobacteria bacterium]|nr:hypothetical protein [Deltaproteobacteria bacterium]
MARNRRRHYNQVDRATITRSRLIAVRVLHRVEVDGAFASIALDAEIKRTAADKRDAALATEIVYGSLRVMPELDRAIDRLIKNDISQLDPLTRATLRAAVYQLNHLARVPAHAIVDEAVSLIHEKRGRPLAGFVNALLRNLANRRPKTPDPPKTVLMPAWLRSELEASLSPEELRAVTEAKPLPPPVCLRTNVERISREELAGRIRESVPVAKVELGALSPLSILVRAGGNPRGLPGYEQGHFSVQEEGAQLVGLLTGAQPGESIADLCAGHGGKTTLLSTLVGETGRVTAIDINQDKLDRIFPELERLGLEKRRVDIEAIDLRVGIAGLKPIFDRVLVDAPCSGIGTIHRRPDLLLRLTPSDLDHIKKRQIAILERAFNLVRPNGRLIYAVCSPIAAEGAEVARVLEKNHKNLQRVVPDNGSLAKFFNANVIGRIGPWNSDDLVSSPDMYQVIQWLVG